MKSFNFHSYRKEDEDWYSSVVFQQVFAELIRKTNIIDVIKTIAINSIVKSDEEDFAIQNHIFRH